MNRRTLVALECCSLLKYHAGLSTENSSKMTVKLAKTIPKRASHFQAQKLATIYIARSPVATNSWTAEVREPRTAGGDTSDK